MGFHHISNKWGKLYNHAKGVPGGGGSAYREFADTFTRDDGAVGNNWLGNTWAIASGKVANNPTLGSEVFVDGAMENWNSATDLTSWTESLSGTSTVNQEGTVKHGGSYSARFDIDASGSLVYIRQNAPVFNGWGILDGWIQTTGSAQATYALNGGTSSPSIISDGSFVNVKAALYGGGGRVQIMKSLGSSASIYTDDNSYKTLTTSELGLTRPVYQTSDYVLEITVSPLSRGAIAGIIFALDDPANPQNYCVAVLGGYRPALYQIKAGIRTDLIASLNPQPTYVSSGKLTVAKRGDSVRIFLDDVVVDTTKTIDATVSAGLYAGIFSTNADSLLDGWSEQVRNTGGSTSFLDAFFPA